MTRGRIAAMLLAAAILGAASGPPRPPQKAPTAPSVMALPATKIMVLGVWHLDGADKAFRTEWLAPVLCRLHAYKPDVVLTEAMPGEQVVGLEAYKAWHGGAGRYAGPTLTIEGCAGRAEARPGRSARAGRLAGDAASGNPG